MLRHEGPVAHLVSAQGSEHYSGKESGANNLSDFETIQRIAGLA